MTPEALAALLSPQGWALLQALPPYDERLALRMSQRLHDEGLDPTLVAAVLTQSRLRAKARGKLGDFADGMLFTPTGLEQATRLTVAAHHAQRYRAADLTCVADLTCGIGADAMALAGVGLKVRAAELDEVTAAVATVNLRHFPEATVEHTDGLTLDLAGVDGLWADPARRRRSGSRVFNPASFSPALDQVLAMRQRVPALGIKLGPGLAHSAVPADARAQWVSVDGDVVEVGLWFGPLAPEGPGRTALVLTGNPASRAAGNPASRAAGDHAAGTAGDEAHTVVAGPDGPPRAVTGPVGGYLYEPDGAVIRAGLVGQVAADIGGWLVDPTIAYLTCDHRADSPVATGYRVLDDLPFGVKTLRTYLRQRDVGRLEVKKRGTAVTPETLRAQLGLRGSAAATVVLTRVAGAQRVLVVERL